MICEYSETSESADHDVLSEVLLLRHQFFVVIFSSITKAYILTITTFTFSAAKGQFFFIGVTDLFVEHDWVYLSTAQSLPVST